MNALEIRFLEPLDVLFLRGNKLFGDPGSFGESLVPPWPSVVAGALRSRMLADDGVDLAAFAEGRIEHPTLGTPAKPGTFAVAAFHLARRKADGTIEALIQAPADLVIHRGLDDEPDAVRVLRPTPLAPGLLASSPSAVLPVLAESVRRKPVSGYWLTEAGWRKYAAGGTPLPSDLVHSSGLWQIEPRVGVGLDVTTRRAADGRLFSVQAVVMASGVGFLVGIRGAVPPVDGSVRLGGDGRAAAVRAAPTRLPEPDYETIARAGRCRLILATPGIFPGGWRLPGMGADNTFQLGQVKARVACAAVPRAEVISGWDLAQRRPKAAQRAAPVGSVYWLDELEATAPALRELVASGLWDESANIDPQRRAEGFNRIWLASWT